MGEMEQREKEYLQLVEAYKQEQTARMRAENNFNQSSGFNSAKEPNVIEYQLSLDYELDRLFHLLSGHILVRDSNGGDHWEEPNDDRLRIFSDYGVKQIMNILQFYINKNTLLSNYTDEQINWKVKHFGIEIADLIYNRYEHFFHYPSPEELFEKMYAIITKNYSYFPELLIQNEEEELEIDENLLYQKCLQWSREELQSKFRHYPMIIKELVDSVHTTYLRALKGSTARQINTNTNIHQNLNGPESEGIVKRGLFGWTK